MTPNPRRHRRTVVAAVALAAVTMAVVGPASPAGATATGTDHSEVDAVEPDAAREAMELRVLDGAEEVELTVRPGHRVEVPGYEGEPWLRIDADGQIEENTASPAGWVNRSADGSTPVPPGATADAEPRWVPRSERSSIRWHDHRVHDMGDGGAVDEGVVKDWEVQLVVDGGPTVVHGTLHRLPAPAPLPWLAVAVVAAAVGVAWARRRSVARSRILASVAAGAALVTAGAGIVGGSSVTTADVLPFGLALAAAALVAVVGIGPTGRWPTTRRALLVLVAAGLAAGSVVPQASAVVHPVVVSALADEVVRFAVSVAGGLLVAVALVLTWTGLGAAPHAGADPPRAASA